MANGCINNLQMEHGMDSFGTEFRYRQPETGQLQGGLVPVDFATIAAGYGCKTGASPPGRTAPRAGRRPSRNGQHPD